MTCTPVSLLRWLSLTNFFFSPSLMQKKDRYFLLYIFIDIHTWIQNNIQLTNDIHRAGKVYRNFLLLWTVAPSYEIFGGMKHIWHMNLSLMITHYHCNAVRSGYRAFWWPNVTSELHKFPSCMLELGIPSQRHIMEISGFQCQQCSIQVYRNRAINIEAISHLWEIHSDPRVIEFQGSI